MASYIEWNQALVEYFTMGVAQGARVYLSVDDDVLERIGRQFGSSDSWRDDFCQAVRKKIGINSSSGGNTVNLDGMRNSFSNPPICVAFLGLMVLAAYEMDRDESSNVNASNYYRRLREILNLTTSEFSAPKGMNLHHELWVKWNKWLNDNGFLSTACQGNTQPTKYINYPISQSVLRKADKEKIYKLAQEQGLQNHWNIDSLMTYLCSNTESLTRHLKKLLDENQRFEVIKKAVQDALDDEKAIQDKAVREKISTSNPRFVSNGSGRQKLEFDNNANGQNGNLAAQIYRTESDFFSEYPSFYLYPKQRTGIDLIGTNIVIDGLSPALQQGDLEGWYLPIFDYPISSEILNQGARYQIMRSPSNDISTYLVLDKRDFWILTPEPDCPESGIYASFGKVALGQTFILLCRKELVGLVERLQSEQLLRFNLCSEVFENNPDWVEFQQCMILSEDWEGVDLGIEGKQLKDALQPAATVEISLTGGLRVPHLKAWLIDDIPALTIFSSIVDQAEVLIFTDLSRERVPISRQIVNTNVSYSNIFKTFGTIRTGSYGVRVNCGKLSSHKTVNFVNWDDLEIREPLRKEILKIGKIGLNGSQILSLGEEIHE
jgi:regulator of replication initiation timing